MGRICKNGFTIVELVVVIVVMGILASVTVMGYGSWQTRVATNTVKSELTNAATSLKSARNFSNTYPADVLTTYKPSVDVTLSGGSSDGQTYCIQATSKKILSVSMYVTDSATDPKSGSCSVSNGLIAWWPLNGNTNDESGHGNNGTAYNTTPAVGQNGQANGAYSFNGGSSYISNIPSMSVANAITLSAWVYSNNFSQNGFIVTKSPINTQWEIFFEGYATRWRGGAPYDNNTYCGIPAPNAWHHIVGTQTGGNTGLYVDGTLCGSYSGSPVIGNDNGVVEIGRFNSGYYFNGSIDDVRIYNRALSASDVQALYNQGAQ